MNAILLRRKQKRKRKVTKFTLRKICKSTWLKAGTREISEKGFFSTRHFPFKDDVPSKHEFLPSSTIIQTPVSAKLDL
jgi:hypothetical protein